MMWYNIKTIKEKNRISEVARELDLKPNKGFLACLNLHCRQVSNGQPTVRINERINTFECTVCHEQGDVIDFVCFFTRLGKFDAIKYLAEKAGITPDPGSNKAVIEQKILTQKKISEVYGSLIDICEEIPQKCEQWLEANNISIATAKKMWLGFIADYTAVVDNLKKRYPEELLRQSGLFNKKNRFRFWVQRLVIPYFKDGVPVYIQAKSIDGRHRPQEKFPARPLPYPYNIDCLKNNNGRIFLCRGVMNALILINHGLNAISMPESYSFQNRWLPLFRQKFVTIIANGSHNHRQEAKMLMCLLNDNEAKAELVNLPQGMDVHEFFLIQNRFFNQKRF